MRSVLRDSGIIWRRLAHQKQRSVVSCLASRELSSTRPLIHEEPKEWESMQVVRGKDASAKVSQTSRLATKPVQDTRDHAPSSDSAPSPTILTYTGGVEIPITNKLHIVTPGEDTPRGTWPVFRLMVSIVSWRLCFEPFLLTLFF
jgi:hypothetical protein